MRHAPSCPLPICGLDSPDYWFDDALLMAHLTPPEQEWRRSCDLQGVALKDRSLRRIADL